MEICDLYDLDRHPTGETGRRNSSPGEHRFLLAVHVCIFDGNGHMLIQRRQQGHISWPSLWDLSTGGCAIAGETSRAAAMREAREELGLELDMEFARPALSVSYKHGFNDIFILSMDLDPASLTLQTEEVSEVRWATLDEILELIDCGAFIPYAKSLIELLFFMRRYGDARITDGVDELRWPHGGRHRH